MNNSQLTCQSIVEMKSLCLCSAAFVKVFLCVLCRSEKPTG